MINNLLRLLCRYVYDLREDKDEDLRQQVGFTT
jgi:hypothetical protein